MELVDFLQNPKCSVRRGDPFEGSFSQVESDKENRQRSDKVLFASTTPTWPPCDRMNSLEPIV